MSLIGRFHRAVFSAILAACRPLLFWLAARERRNGAWRQRPPVREAETTRPEPAIRALQASAEATDAMLAELRRVLDQDESFRHTFRHLARFERKFAKYGMRTIAQLPVADLRRALRDFEALVRNWSSASLADLRSRMAVVLADRSSAASMWIAENSITAERHNIATPMVGRSARAGLQGARGLGMSRFEILNRGFQSTSAPA